MRSARLSAPWRPPGRLNVSLARGHRRRDVVAVRHPRRSSCPTCRACSARPRRWRTSMQRMPADDCTAPPSGCCPIPRPIGPWCWRSTICNGLTETHCMLLSELLTVSLRNVLVVGAHRAGGFEPGSAGFSSPGLRCIELARWPAKMSRNCSRRCPARVVELGDVAAEFHQRTQGNPLQVRQLLYRAQREGALIPVGPGGRRSWDLRVLASLEVTATAAEFLGSYLDQLEPQDRSVLSSLSCYRWRVRPGRRHRRGRAAARRGGPGTLGVPRASSSSRPSTAADRRIANAISRDARYRFSHDRVVRGGASRPVRRGHTRNASADRPVAVGQGDDRLFEAARHVGIGGHGLADEAERVRFVEVLRRAAQKARAQASFPLALEYCRNALDLLGAQRWTVHFDLTRQLQLDAADAALCWSATCRRCMRYSTRPNRTCASLRTARGSPTCGSRGESRRAASRSDGHRAARARRARRKAAD